MCPETHLWHVSFADGGGVETASPFAPDLGTGSLLHQSTAGAMGAHRGGGTRRVVQSGPEPHPLAPIKGPRFLAGSLALMNHRILRRHPVRWSDPVANDQTIGPCAHLNGVAIHDVTCQQISAN